MRQWLGRFRRPSDEEFAAEVEAHLAHEADDLMERGLPPDEARHAALRRFGNVTRHLERFREASPWFWLETLWQDVRYGWRSLWRTPIITTIAIASLAVGIGANAALYTVARAVLLAPLRLPDPDRVFFVRDAGTGDDYLPLPVQEEITRLAAPFAVAGPWLQWECAVRYGDQISLEWIWLASDGATSALGLQPALGRWPTPAEQQAGAQVAVLTHRLWHQFGEDPHVLGRQLGIYGRSYSIIGVAPPEFRGIDVGLPYGVVVPLRAVELLEPGALSRFSARMLGRLRPEYSLRRAADQVAGWHLPRRGAQAPPLLRLLTPREALVSQEEATRLRRILAIVSVLAGLVLLIGCANLGSAMLARADLRGRELAMRITLGATHGRLLRLLAVEFGMLTAFSTVAALIVSRWMLVSVVGVLGSTDVTVLPLEVNAAIVVFTIVVGTISCVAFGVIPTLRSMRVSAANALRWHGDTRTASRVRPRHALLTVQIGTSSILLVSALLLQTAVTRATTLGLGLDRRDVLVNTVVSLAGSRHEPDRVAALRQSLLDRLREDPSFISAAFSFGGGFSAVRHTNHVVVDGIERPPSNPAARGEEQWRVWADWVDPSFRRTVGLPLLRGRDLTMDDTVPSGGGVLVNESLARSLWPGQGAIGKRLRLYIPPPPGWAEAQKAGFGWMPGFTNFGWIPAGGSAIVVGVVGDMRFNVKTGSSPCVYFAAGPADARVPVAGLYVRMRGGSAQAVRAVREAIRLTLPDEPPSTVVSREEHVLSQLTTELSALGLARWFGCGAIALSVLGVYGLATHTITRRARELAIRLALGSSPGALTRLALWSAVVPLAVGGAIGLLTAAGCATMFLRPLIVGANPLAPSVYLATAALLGTVAAIALYWPARRVGRIDPASTLRSE